MVAIFKLVAVASIAMTVIMQVLAYLADAIFNAEIAGSFMKTALICFAIFIIAALAAGLLAPYNI